MDISQEEGMAQDQDIGEVEDIALERYFQGYNDLDKGLVTSKSQSGSNPMLL